MTSRVASIYFMGLSARRPLFGGVFDAAPVLKGEKPFILSIADHIQPEKMPHILGGGYIPRRIAGDEIARDIVREWSAEGLGMNVACGPGVWVVRDAIPIVNENGIQILDADGTAQFRPATDEEKEQMWAEDVAAQTMRQENWGAYLKQQGDMLDADPEKKRAILITPTMRAAAAYYGYAVDWMDRKLREGDRMACRWCTKIIPSNALVCPECSRVVDARRAALAEEIDKLTARAALKAQQQQPQQPQEQPATAL